MNSLLSFYRKQCENNEKQIADLVQSISDLDPAYEELSKSRLEAEKKTSEITRLHNYASGLNSAIIEEKEKSLSLQGEVERLKVVEMELSKENSSLLDKIGGGRGITREEVTFYRDCRPERLRRHQPQPNLPDSPSRINSADASTLASPARSMRGRLGPQATGASSSSSIPGPNTPGSAPSTPTRSKRTPVHHAHTAHNTSRQVLRTVYLPNERADALVLMVESLSSQLEEHKNLSKQHIQTVIDEFKERESTFIARINDDQSTIDNLTERCNTVEKRWRDSVHHEKAAIQKLQVAERIHAERQVSNKEDIANLHSERSELARELDKFRKNLQSHSAAGHRNLLQQVSEREKDVHTLREQYKELQTVYDSKLQSLEHKLRQSREKFKSLEERRKVEIAAFQKDIGFFKNNIRQLERELMNKKKDEIANSGTSRSRSSSMAVSSPSLGPTTPGPRLTDDMTETQRNASIVSHITDFNYNPSQIPANEDFYGGLAGQLNTDVHNLKSRVANLAKEVTSDEVGAMRGEKGAKKTGKKKGLGGKSTVLSEYGESGAAASTSTNSNRRRVVEPSSTSMRRGTYFGAVDMSKIKDVDITSGTDAKVINAWLSAKK